MPETMNFDVIISSRSVTGQTVAELGEQYPNLWTVTPDIGATLTEFREKFPERFVDVGLSEQTSIGVASGLAYEGNIVVVSGMLPFLSMRALEQVRSDLCDPNLPVRIIGTHGGLQGNGGSTHYAVDSTYYAMHLGLGRVQKLSRDNSLAWSSPKAVPHEATAVSTPDRCAAITSV